MLELFNKFWREEEGQDLVEYALIVALIALVAVITIKPLGNAISSVFQDATNRINARE